MSVCLLPQYSLCVLCDLSGEKNDSLINRTIKNDSHNKLVTWKYETTFALYPLLQPPYRRFTF
jgi:hypothetical protein